MFDQCSDKGEQSGSIETCLSVKEQILLALFRQLSIANQEHVLRCAEVLTQIPDE